jgi:hypothetical protein
MLLSDALEVAIGLTFVFLLLSMIMTALLELIESVTRTRGASLLQGLQELLGDPARAHTGAEAARAIYTHPLVQGLYRGSFEKSAEEKRLPSYIPTRSFALALIDQVLAARINAAASNASIPGPAHASVGERLRLAAERVENEQLRRALTQAVRVGGDDVERIAKQLGEWYDAAMDRVSGRYKRRAHQLLFWLGLAAAVVLNLNTLSIMESLSKDATLRRAVVAQAEAQAQAGSPGAGQDALAKIGSLGLPIGWSGGALDALLLPTERGGQTDALSVVLGAIQIVTGYLLTALAVTLGAPFWFDVLNRLMVIRATVKPREKSPEEGSEDRPPADKHVTIVNEAPLPVALPPVPPAARAVDSDIYAEVPGADEKPFEEWD